MLTPLILQGDMWMVLASLACYQVYLQSTLKHKIRYHEGMIKNIQYLIGIPALIFLGVYLFDPDELGFVFIHIPYILRAAGLFIFNTSALVIFWAHATLGNFWSGELETRTDHEVIDTGPYRFIRHPLYTSYIFMTLGLFLMTQNWLVGGTMFLYFLSVAARSWTEEEMLLERLGVPYWEYMNRTNRFFFGKRTRRSISKK